MNGPATRHPPPPSGPVKARARRQQSESASCPCPLHVTRQCAAGFETLVHDGRGVGRSGSHVGDSSTGVTSSSSPPPACRPRSARVRIVRFGEAVRTDFECRYDGFVLMRQTGRNLAALVALISLAA